MNALMQSYPIDKKPLAGIDMAALAETLKDAENIDGLTPIDINSPDHLKNYFANGAYVREMILPANTAVVGRIHKHKTINILLEGEITVIDENGVKTDMKAPHVFIATAGNQKAAMTRTKVRWLNSWACDTTDPEVALALLTCETMHDFNRFIDSEDIKSLNSELGHTEHSMRLLINSQDVVMNDIRGLRLGDSDIDGTGVFADEQFNDGCFIAHMRAGELRSIAGRFTNHSLIPNSRAKFIDGELSLICTKTINPGDEITCNYRDVLSTINKQEESS